MNEINLASVDLNLLHVLATVLEEGSATRAAKKLNVSQSAVSNSLRRAREIFDDPLVRRRPHGLEPTPHAATIQPKLREWIEGAHHILTAPQTFNPKNSSHTFRLACSDAVTVTLLQPILKQLRKHSPRSQLRLVSLDHALTHDSLARGEIDLLIGRPPTLAKNLESEPLYNDPMRCIVRADHPKIRTRLSLNQFSTLPHIDFSIFGRINDTIDRALAAFDRSRTVQIALPHFSSIPLAIAESDCIATLSHRLALVFAKQIPLRILKPPIDLPPIEIRQVWHRRSNEDNMIEFLRKIVRDAARNQTTA